MHFGTWRHVSGPKRTVTLGPTRMPRPTNAEIMLSPYLTVRTPQGTKKVMYRGLNGYNSVWGFLVIVIVYYSPKPYSNY